MISITAATLHAIAPRFSGARARRQHDIIKAVEPMLVPTLERYRISSLLRVSHFLAQICHESAGFRTTEEFASGAAYEGREDLGNVRPGDGRRFKGRGLLQLTGRANYARFGDKLGIDLIADPDRAAEPALSLEIACLYWRERSINSHADSDDLIRVTRLVNGGTNGLADRRIRLCRAKVALAGISAERIRADHRPVLRRGSRDPDGAMVTPVADLQAALRRRGSPLAVDGDFGPATELAVITWQRRNCLAPDGIVGPRTWGSFEADGCG